MWQRYKATVLTKYKYIANYKVWIFDTRIFMMIEQGGLSFKRNGWWKPFSEPSSSDDMLDNSPMASDFDKDLQ